MKGKVIKIQRELFHVQVDGEVILSKAKGAWRQKDKTPYVGDLVEVRLGVEEDRGLIEKIYPRKNQLLRPPVVNIDQLLIIVSMKYPNLHLELLDRYLIHAEKEEIPAVILLNKVDLVSEEEVERIQKIYEKIGYLVYRNSFEDLNKDLKDLFKGKTTAVTGPSGAGKSTLLNGLFNLDLETGSVSKKTGRGKQTTRHIEILPLEDDSYVLDTPGFSSLSVDFLDSDETLDLLFPEFRNKNCRFLDCKHMNEPHCGVKSALEKGEIEKSRYESYLTFEEELKERRNTWPN